jgi:hypothetical protein
MVWTSLTKISIIKMAVFRHWSAFYSYLRYKSKKLSFIARTGLKYDLGTREYFKGCECHKGTFYTYLCLTTFYLRS